MGIDDLRSTLSGSAVTEQDSEWDEARLFHSGIGEPSLVVRADVVGDVQAAVRYAAAESSSVMARGGGHSAWGTVAGGVTIDLAALDSVEVDGEIVRVGGGTTWGQVAAELAHHGLGLSSGDTASVGVGGLTLGGGIGWMVRAWGLACDQLVGVQLITAAGEIVEVTDQTLRELMGALRGGGGNFGVVTRFDFRAHRLPAVVFTTLAVTGDASSVLRTLRDTMADAPREVTVTYMDVPAMDPNAPAGATISACWAGDDEEGSRAALAPLLAGGDVAEVDSGVRAYPDVLLDMPAADPAQPMPGFIGGNTLLRDLTDDAIDRLVRFRRSSDAAVLLLRSIGGAYGDVSRAESVFPARDATWFAMAGAFDIPGLVDDDTRAGYLEAWDAIEAVGAGVYGNFSTSTDASYATKMYPPETRSRLAAVKRTWDPANVFDRNHNVVPA